MHFTYLKLVSYKRFPLRDFEILEHEFKSKLIMVSGPNGAGKSSLFGELSPLPTNKNDFGKGGYKEIHIRKGKDVYKLICDFRDGAKYSFLLNDEELNQAGIVSIQKDLAQAHFGISQVIHDILIGNETLTDMSLLARKKLFNAITHLNIDKVLSGYETLKEELKVANLVLKSRMSAHQTESERLIGEENREAVERDLSAIKAHIDLLIDLRSDIGRHLASGPSLASYDKLANAIAGLNGITKLNYTLFTSYPFKDLPRLREETSAKLAVIQARLQDFYSAMVTKQTQLESVKCSNDVAREEIEQRIKELQVFIDTCDQRLFFTGDYLLNPQAEAALYKASTYLQDIMETMLPNMDTDGSRIYTKDRYDAMIAYRERTHQKLTALLVNENVLKNEVDNVASLSGTVNCSSCNAQLNLSELVESRVQLDRGNLKDLQKEIEYVKSELGRTERTLEELNTYFGLYKQYFAIRNDSYDILKPMWNAIDESGYVFSDPPSVMGYIHRANNDFIILQEVKATGIEINKLRKDILDIEYSNTFNSEQLKAEVGELTDIVTSLQSEKFDLQETLNAIKYAEDMYKMVAQIDQLIKGYTKDVQTYNLDSVTKSIIMIIDDKLRELKLQHIELEKLQHQSEVVQATLARYMEEIADTEESIRVLNLALEELCPKTGLIAKSISSFINTIISSVNDTLAKIWNYKMVLVPIDVETSGLNYKFRVDVEDRHSIPDVSLLSKGMKKGVNLCFKLVLYRLLGLENFPLYLDELASNLDPAHSGNMSQLVHSLHMSDQFSQIFLITHKENFGFLKGIETIDLG